MQEVDSTRRDLTPPPSIGKHVIACLIAQRYAVDIMVIAVKPPLVGPSYQFFMEASRDRSELCLKPSTVLCSAANI